MKQIQESIVCGKGTVFYSSIGAPPPKVGQLMTVRNVRCRIVKIRPAGTLDLVSLCGGYAFRVSGLPFVGGAQ